MHKEERNKLSPLRILEKSIRGGMIKGNLAVITALKGVGKTACLVHIATEKLFEGKHVIHVSFSSNTNHIISWYDEIFEEISCRTNLESAKKIHDEMMKNRIIMNFNQNGAKISQITKSLRYMIQDGNFTADTIMIDGFDFKKATPDDLKEIKDLAEELKIEIWFSATLQDDDTFDEKDVPLFLKNYLNYIAIVIVMQPHGKYTHLELVKDHDVWPTEDIHLMLDPETLLIIEEAVK